MSRRAGARGWALRLLPVVALSAVWLTPMPAAAEPSVTKVGTHCPVHYLPLDEGFGNYTFDVAGGRLGTLHNGAELAEGRVGNAVSLDGVDDHVSTTGVDLRTDTSFSVAAWVYLEEKPGQQTAVSLDGDRTSKFRLGQVMDGQHRLGSWVFEMPESDTDGALFTEKAVSTWESETETWIHLTGVYDASADRLWLYVNGSRTGDGTVQNTWNADGGLQIGRGKADGAAGEFWPGKVDDVRLYDRILSDEDVVDLYQSYPDAAGTITASS